MDLSSKECKLTGYALLSQNLEIIEYGHFHKNDEIITYTIRVKPNIISIDAPLSMGNKGFRRCERKLINAGFRVYPVTIKWMRELSLRAIYIANKLRNLGFEVIETHPTSSLRACGFKGNIKSKMEILHFICDKWNLKLNENMSRHIIDAVISALAGISYLNKKALIFEAEDGAIILAKV